MSFKGRDEMNKIERRGFERKNCYIEAKYESPNLSLNVVLSNISEGGCFILSPFLDTPGTSGALFLRFPKMNEPVVLLTKVVYTKDDTISSSGMGIKFIYNSPEVVERMKQILQSM